MKEAVQSPAVTIVRTLALLAVLVPVAVLGHSAYAGGSLFWSSVEGTVVSAERAARKGCVVRVDRPGSSRTIELAFDACDSIRAGDTLTKPAWSLDARSVSASGTTWLGSVPHVVFSLVALLFIAVIGVIAVLAIFIYLPVRLPRSAQSAG